jgi:cyclin C
MASNFWHSSHARWLMPKARADAAHRDDLAQGLSRAKLARLHAALAQWAFDVAHAARLRQRVAATALVYFRRLYACAAAAGGGGGAGATSLPGLAALGGGGGAGGGAGAGANGFHQQAGANTTTTTSFGAHDPRVVILGAVCLAAKAEESAVAVRTLCAAARRLRPGWPHDARAVLDAEALLVDALGARLLVYDPYAPLECLLRRDPRLAELGQNAWAALNDAFRSPDLPLRHAPHTLAAGALLLACAVCGRDVDGGLWVAREAGADLDAVMDVVSALCDLYEGDGGGEDGALALAFAGRRRGRRSRKSKRRRGEEEEGGGGDGGRGEDKEEEDDDELAATEDDDDDDDDDEAYWRAMWPRPALAGDGSSGADASAAAGTTSGAAGAAAGVGGTLAPDEVSRLLEVAGGGRQQQQGMQQQQQTQTQTQQQHQVPDLQLLDEAIAEAQRGEQQPEEGAAGGGDGTSGGGGGGDARA